MSSKPELINPQLFAQFLKHAQANPKEEVVGLVLKDLTFIPLTNELPDADDRKHHFAFNGKHLLPYQLDDSLLGYFHSHPQDDPAPSNADLYQCAALDLIMYIINPLTQQLTITTPSEANDLLSGKRYEEYDNAAQTISELRDRYCGKQICGKIIARQCSCNCICFVNWITWNYFNIGQALIAQLIDQQLFERCRQQLWFFVVEQIQVRHNKCIYIVEITCIIEVDLIEQNTGIIIGLIQANVIKVFDIFLNVS